jgi:phage gp29-like protein
MLATQGNMSFYEPDQLLSEQMKPKQALPMELAIRETAWNYYRVLGYLPNPSETLRRLGKDIAEFKYLLEDSYVNGVFSSRKAGCQGLKWSLDQNECPQEQYDTIKDVLESIPTHDIIGEMLNCIWFGYQPCEVIWERVDGLILPKSIVPKDPDWFRFSDINELRYLTKRNMVTGEPVPPFKFLLPRYRASYERPYGRPLAASCYWSCKFRHTGFRFLTLFVEKYGMPWVKLSYPLGTQQARIAEMIDVVNSTMQDGIIAWPTEFAAEVVDVNKTASADIFKSYIQMSNDELSIAILGQTLTTKMDSAGGSFAAASVHGGIRDDLVDGDTHIIEDTFNTLIEWIYQLNWTGAKEIPEFKLIRDVFPTKDDAEMTLKLTQSGVKFNASYFQARFNMNEDEFTMGTSAAEASATATLNPPAVPGKSSGADGKDMAIESAAHESKDSATKTDTYKSTKSAVNTLKGR